MSLPPGRYLRLCISDTGPGIQPDSLDKIFDPFFTTKGKAEGTGLGLAVVHGIITAHKGAVVVSSIPWERTSFDIYLPLLDRASAADQRQAEQVRRGQGRILFVEDDLDQLATIPRVLGRLGYEVKGSSSAAMALRSLGDAPGSFDLVLTDFDMPGVNGVEFARRLLAEHPGLPVVMVSGRLHAGEMPPDLPRNILRVLAKPYGVVKVDAAPGVITITFKKDPPIDSMRIIEMIQKNRHIKLAGSEKLRIERALPEAKDRAHMVRDVLRALGQPKPTQGP